MLSYSHFLFWQSQFYLLVLLCEHIKYSAQKIRWVLKSNIRYWSMKSWKSRLTYTVQFIENKIILYISNIYIIIYLAETKIINHLRARVKVKSKSLFKCSLNFFRCLWSTQNIEGTACFSSLLGTQREWIIL